MKAGRVAILGGGVAGLTAAHELVRRGFDVDLYERRAAIGGKARSQFSGGLPGEHGFRFYPAFYRHLIATMAEIPAAPPNTGRSVADLLVPAPEAAIAEPTIGVRCMLRRRPQSVFELWQTVRFVFAEMEVPPSDLAYYTYRVLRYFCASDERREHEFEALSWWEFLDGERYSPRYQACLRAATRTMVAMDPDRASAFTVGNISMQLLKDQGGDGSSVDRTLSGPTTPTWLDPWKTDLTARGVRFHLGATLDRLEVDGGRIARAWVNEQPVEADHYVLAVPLEVAASLMSDDLTRLDPALARFAQARACIRDLTNWMVGAQFFLARDAPIASGHVCYAGSPWALTSISQAQFWSPEGPNVFRQRYGAGRVEGVLSVDVADWFADGKLHHRPASRCSREQIYEELVAELLTCLTRDGQPLLRREDIVGWHLDEELEIGPAGTINHSPLLVHPPGSRALRPSAVTAVPNLFLASDYVRTLTDMASMEAANEAGRRAVRGLLEACGCSEAPPALFPMEEPDIFRFARRMDARLFGQGARLAVDDEAARLWDAPDVLEAASGTEGFQLEDVAELERRMRRLEPPAAALVSEAPAKRLAAAFSVYGVAEAQEIVDLMASDVHDRTAWPEAEPILAELRRWARFDWMVRLGELAWQRSPTPGVLVLYAQALVDSGRATDALAVLGARDETPGIDRVELWGMRGRAYKQLYIDARPNPAERRLADLESALRWYTRSDPPPSWHGINTVALLLHAARRAPHDERGALEERARTLARAVLDRLEPRPGHHWDIATALEACLALQDVAGCSRFLDAYLTDRATDVFAVQSTLRQLEQVWELRVEEPPGASLLPRLRDYLIREGGCAVDVAAREAGSTGLDDRYMSLPSYQAGFRAARAVALIVRRGGSPIGTAFVVGPRHVLTNAHVVPGQCSEDEVTVVLTALIPQGRREQRSVRRRFDHPDRTVDASLLELDGQEFDPDVPLAVEFMSDAALERAWRAYVIGHPGARQDIQLSLQDSRLVAYDAKQLQYLTPTEWGSSGSPVFDAHWRVIGLHCGRTRRVLPRAAARGLREVSRAVRTNALQPLLDVALAGWQPVS
jgi:uncharacterized protein with NAD-binding domain and iron-sulfur cluster